MGKFLKTRQIKYLPALSAIGFIMMSLRVDNFVVYKKIYAFWYIILVMIFIMAASYGVYHLKKSRHAFVFVITFFYMAAYTSLILIIEYSTSSLRLNSPLVYIIIFAAIPVLFTFEELTYKEKQISHAKEEKEREYINSLTDNLTGVWNQRFIYNKLEEKIRESTIAMIDLDNFKPINDTYSHLAGDLVLKKFATLAKASIRKDDDVCRYGGDEFIIILYDCPLNKAVEAMEKLKQEVETYEFVYQDEVVHITISIGLYKTNKDDTVKTAIGQVDQQLYQAKKQGKNCIAY